jgi:hypothetical protein
MKAYAFPCLAVLAILGGCAPAARRIVSAEQPRAVTQTSTAPDALKLLRDVTRAAASAGARELTVLGFGAATPGDRIEGMVHVPKGTCALFVTRATPTVEDLDLHVYGDDGSQYGIDESPDALPTLLLCPETEARLFASARVAQGDGLIALGVQTVARADAPSVAQAVGARHFATGIAPVKEPWPGLLDALEERRAALGGVWVDHRRVALPLDSRVPTHMTLDVPRGRCLDVLVLPDPDASGLQLSILDEKGRIFAHGEALGQRQAAVLCANRMDTSVTFEFRPFAGRGVAAAAFSISEGGVSSLDSAPDVSVTLVDEGQEPADRERLKAPLSTTKWKLHRGEVVSFETQLKGCNRLDLIPDRDLSDFEAQVWSADGDLLAELESRRGIPMFVCVDGLVRIDLAAQGRSGELTVELRSEKPSSGLLPGHPLAASRLLSRAHIAGYLTYPEDIGRVTALEVSNTKLGRFSLTVPASHCQTIFLAGGPGAFGLEARVIDVGSGLELDRSVGRTSVTLRACAPEGGGLNAVLEVRATSGATRALWAARQERLPRQN